LICYLPYMSTSQSEMKSFTTLASLYGCSVNCPVLGSVFFTKESLLARPHILHVYIVVLTSGYICGFHWHIILPFSFPLNILCVFQSSRFNPRGAIVLNRWIHLRSTLFLMVNDAWLFGGFLMNSKILMVMSNMPL